MPQVNRMAVQEGVGDTLDALARARAAMAATAEQGRELSPPPLPLPLRDYRGKELMPASQVDLQAQLKEMQEQMAAVRARVAATLRDNPSM